MKLLHVGRPDEVDDNKEVDLLRRLAVLWDAPDEQLSEIMQEVDTWLESKSEQAVSYVWSHSGVSLCST